MFPTKLNWTALFLFFELAHMQEILSWENIPKSCEDEVPLGFVDSPITSKSNSKNVFSQGATSTRHFQKDATFIISGKHGLCDDCGLCASATYHFSSQVAPWCYFCVGNPRRTLGPRVSSSKRETQRGSLSPKGNLLIFWVLGLSTKKNRSAEPLRKWNGEVSHKRQWWFKVITSWGLLWNQTENGYMNNNYISCVWCHHGSISILTYQGVTLKRWLGPHHCSDTVVNTSSQQFSDLVPGKSFMFQSSWKAK